MLRTSSWSPCWIFLDVPIGIGSLTMLLRLLTSHGMIFMPTFVKIQPFVSKVVWAERNRIQPFLTDKESRLKLLEQARRLFSSKLQSCGLFLEAVKIVRVPVPGQAKYRQINHSTKVGEFNELYCKQWLTGQLLQRRFWRLRTAGDRRSSPCISVLRGLWSLLPPFGSQMGSNVRDRGPSSLATKLPYFKEIINCDSILVRTEKGG